MHIIDQRYYLYSQLRLRPSLTLWVRIRNALMIRYPKSCHTPLTRLIVDHRIFNLGCHISLHKTCTGFLFCGDGKHHSGKSWSEIHISYPCKISLKLTRAFFFSFQACIPLFILTLRHMYIRPPKGQSLHDQESKRSQSNKDQRRVLAQNCLLLFLTSLLHVPVLAWEVRHQTLHFLFDSLNS